MTDITLNQERCSQLARALDDVSLASVEIRLKGLANEPHVFRRTIPPLLF